MEKIAMDKPLSHLFQDLGDVIGSILDHPDTTPEIKNALNAFVCDLDNQAGNIKTPRRPGRARYCLPH